jgi:hypothetical protein
MREKERQGVGKREKPARRNKRRRKTKKQVEDQAASKRGREKRAVLA